MGAVVSATNARRGIIASRLYRRLNRYSNSARYRATCFFSHGSVGPHEGGFDVAQRGIDPFESRGAGRLLAASGLYCGVLASGLGDSSEACQTVGDDVGSRLERGACEHSDRKTAKGFDGPKDDLIWLAIVRCRDRSDERRLACCAAPAAAGPGAAEIGVVHLDVAFQAFARVTLQHDLSELVLHHPSSRLGDAKASTKLDTGNALL